MKTNIIQIVNNELSFSFNGYETCNYFSKDDFKNHQISSENIWLVPLNLNWENKDFFGLDIGVEIRKKLKSKAPIIFHSYIPEKDIFEIAEKDKDFKYKLLFTPECYYLDSNNLETDLDTLIESSAPISEFCLADINHYIFNAKGRIDELCHNLKNDLTKFDNKEVIIDNFKDACEYEIMIENIERLSDIIINLKNELNLALNKDNTYFDVINKYKPQIISLLPISADDETVVENKNKIINWEVIYLEDEEHIANDIKNWFHENGVRCHLAKNENEVITFLENNKNVVLFITDIRLMDKSKKWHTHQGYDVIEQIAKHSKIPLVFAVLTSKKGSIINSAKQKLNYQIFWENKDNVLHSKHAFDIYFNRLKELADKNFVSNICFKPLSRSWSTEGSKTAKQQKKYISFEKYYKFYKNQLFADYINYESKLNLIDYEKLFVKDVDINSNKGTFVSFASGLTEKSTLDDFADNVLKARRFLLYKVFENPQWIDDFPNDQKKNTFGKVALSSVVPKLIENIVSYYLIKPYGFFHNTEILYEEYKFLLEKGLIQKILDSYSTEESNQLTIKLLEGRIEKETIEYVNRNSEAKSINSAIIRTYGSSILKINVYKIEYNTLRNKNSKIDEFKFLKLFIEQLQKHENYNYTNFYTYKLINSDIKNLLT